MSTVNVHCKPSKNGKDGILYLRITSNRKHTYKTLGIVIPIRYWNKDSQRVNATDKIDYKAINKKLKKELAKYESSEETPEVILEDENKSLIKFFEKINASTFNVGSLKKHNTILNTIKDYLEKKRKKKDLLFKEVNKEFVLDFKRYLLTDKNLSVNTSNRYLIQFKTVINKAIKENHYSYIRHPFLGIETPKESKKDVNIPEDEVWALINYVPTTERMKVIKNKFLFQLFGQGMRVSDLLLQRWSNIYKEGDLKFRLRYIMYKTKQKTDIILNNNLINILGDVLISSEWAQKLNGYKELVKIDNDLQEHIVEKRKEKKPEKIGIARLIQMKKVKKSEGIEERIKMEKEEEVDEALRGYKYLKRTSTLKLISQVLQDKNLKNKFIFEMLDESLFKDFDIEKPTEKQFNQMMSKAAVYNKQLKELQAAVGITETLSSHKARYLFTNLLLINGVDVYSISKSLNHTRLAVTEAYLAKFNVKLVDKANEDLVDSFEI